MFANKMNDIYTHILQSKKEGKKLFAILIDPDKQNNKSLSSIINKANNNNVDFFFVGGSLITNNSLNSCVSSLKENSSIPVVLFPGNAMQVNNKAD